LINYYLPLINFSFPIDHKNLIITDNISIHFRLSELQKFITFAVELNSDKIIPNKREEELDLAKQYII